MSRVSFILLFSFFCELPLVAAREKEVSLPPEKIAEASQLTRHADSLLARKYYEDAILEYLKVLAITPRDHVVHNKLGIAYHQLQRLDLAKKEYETARRIKPDYSEAWNNLGTVYYSLKKYGKAVKEYKKALQLQPNSATAYHNMGAAYFGMKKYDEGFQAYRDAYRLDPTILERVSNYGTIIKTAELNQGMINFYMAKLFAEHGEMEKALAFLLKALENGFNEFEKITKDPDFKVLVQDERLTRFMENKPSQF
jgi:cytochrome c-type biogenesis protein CcmH/NrfG